MDNDLRILQTNNLYQFLNYYKYLIKKIRFRYQRKVNYGIFLIQQLFYYFKIFYFMINLLYILFYDVILEPYFLKI